MLNGKKEKFEGYANGSVSEDEWGRRVKVAMVEGNDMAGGLELVVLGEEVYMVSRIIASHLPESRTDLSYLQPHDDGSLEPLSDLAKTPSYFRTWPFQLCISSYRRILALFASPQIPRPNAAFSLFLFQSFDRSIVFHHIVEKSNSPPRVSDCNGR